MWNTEIAKYSKSLDIIYSPFLNMFCLLVMQDIYPSLSTTQCHIATQQKIAVNQLMKCCITLTNIYLCRCSRSS